MIRDSLPQDTDAIARLCIAQYRRTPWAEDIPATCHGWRVCDRGEITGALSYFVGARLFVTQLWVADGYRGYRAAVELSRDAEKMAEQMSKRVMFDVAIQNTAYQKAVVGAGYVPIAVTFERRSSRGAA
jgi:hypothetical protein